MVQGYPISSEELYGNSSGLNLTAIERVSTPSLTEAIEPHQA
jgi:hypothetical protein